MFGGTKTAIVSRVAQTSNTHVERTSATLAKTIKHTAGIRRAGSAALDMVYVAAGRFDAYFETDLHAWDLAAGALIVREAGGIVSGIDGSENFLETGHILTGTPKIYRDFAKLCSNEIKAMI